MRQKYLSLTPKEKQIVLGTLLGDGVLINREKGPSMRITHSIKQFEYVKWLWEQLPNLKWQNSQVNVTCLCQKPYQLNGREYKPQIAWFETRKHLFFKYLKGLLYNNSARKIVTRKYLNLLDPQGIAVWWCDDGQCNVIYQNGNPLSRVGFLWTSGFSKEENHVIQRWFRNVWGIECTVKQQQQNKKINYYLRFNATNLKRLVKLIKDYVPECMKYKIDMKYSDPLTYDVEYLPTRTVIKTVNKDIV